MFHHQAGALSKRGGSSQQQQQHQARHLRRLAVAAAATATAGAAGLHFHRRGSLSLPAWPVSSGSSSSSTSSRQPLQLPRELAEVICGAVGEIVQVAVLYPLGTIKVRCQAGGLPAAAVLQQLFAPGAGPGAVLRQLYAGVMGASVASVAVGEFCCLQGGVVAVVLLGGEVCFVSGWPSSANTALLLLLLLTTSHVCVSAAAH